MIRQRTHAEKAQRKARRAERASTLRGMGDASAWLALPMTKARRAPIGRRATPRRSERVTDHDHVASVHDLECCARDLGPCAGRIEADHAGRRPAGRKADDSTCIPLCTSHHRQRTDFSGDFRTWDQERMRAWLDERIAATRARLNPITAGDAGNEAL